MKTQKGTEMSVLMPPELREKIKALAAKFMISEAGVVRMVLIQYFTLYESRGN